MRIALPATIRPEALADHDPRATIADLAGTTMGTTWRVTFVRSPSTDPEAMRALIVATLARLVAEMSHWEPGSLLSRFNAAPGGSWHRLPPDFAHVVATGLKIAAQSGGAFDPTIGDLVNIWGYGPRPMPMPPAAEMLRAARERCGWQRLDYEPATRRVRQPGGLALDLSGIAKGYAVDALVAGLHEASVRHCLVEIGGELAGRGVRPDGDPWWVELENPPDVALAPLRIALHGLAVATSGNYRRGDHTIDPSSGRPVANGIVSASVIHAEAMIADAWATALTVLGMDAAIAMAARHALAARIVAIVDGDIRERITPALAAMLAD